MVCNGNKIFCRFSCSLGWGAALRAAPQPRCNASRCWLMSVGTRLVLLYGCEAWTVTPKLSKDLDGCYTRLLRTVFNVNWKQHITNKELYGSLPKVSEKIRDRRLRFAGHCCRSTEEPISRLLLWRPKHGKRKAGRPTITYTDVLQQDTGLETTDMRTAMLDRSVWRAITVRAQVST